MNLDDKPELKGIFSTILALKQPHVLAVMTQLEPKERWIVIQNLLSIRLENLDAIYYHLTYKPRFNPQEHRTRVDGHATSDWDLEEEEEEGDRDYSVHTFQTHRHRSIGQKLVQTHKVVWLIEISDTTTCA